MVVTKTGGDKNVYTGEKNVYTGDKNVSTGDIFPLYWRHFSFPSFEKGNSIFHPCNNKKIII